MQNAAKVRGEYELKKVVLAEQERLEAAKRELNEVKTVADEETINARNEQLSKIAAERAQIEQNTAQYRVIQRARDGPLVSMQESAMSAAKTPDNDFIQSVGNEMAEHANITHQYEMLIRKHMMSTEGI
jgi:aspartyl-tRNA synthetase